MVIASKVRISDGFIGAEAPVEPHAESPIAATRPNNAAPNGCAVRLDRRLLLQFATRVDSTHLVEAGLCVYALAVLSGLVIGCHQEDLVSLGLQPAPCRTRPHKTRIGVRRGLAPVGRGQLAAFSRGASIRTMTT